ncbi:MAG: hypothetical protein WA172_13550 [Terriglobales bacterium]
MALLCSAFLFSQSKSEQPKPPVPSSSLAREFPVTMRQKVVAGKTPVGTKVEAQLTIATLVDHKVIPMGATFSGEVIESAAKAATGPSRLAIRMNEVRWKNGSTPTQVYLTAWYYPIRMPTDENRSNDTPSSAIGRSSTGIYNPNSPTAPPFPGAGGPDAGPASTVSDIRVLMKKVESTRGSDGSVVLTSSHFNLKLDKTTTYVLATGDLMPAK